MADKELTSNVHVDGKWYGPSYPQNKVTADVLEQIDNPAAFADTTTAGPDLRFRADDFDVADGEQPNLRGADAPVVDTATPDEAPKSRRSR